MKVKMITAVFVLCFTAILHASAEAPQVQMSTCLYSVKGADSLWLDRYDAVSAEASKPCVIFMFGGGFIGGTRNWEGYIPYFNFLAREGYTVVSIDYRLGLKNMDANASDLKPQDFPRILAGTINMAVEDLYDATNYVLDNCADWGIDPGAIIACGSSAGAISVLQAEYEICNGSPVSGRLPEGFNYAGVISFAGAIMVPDGGFELGKTPCPVMLLHGDSDSNVPYDHVEIMSAGVYGSKYIASKLAEHQTPYYFISFTGAAHEIADKTMNTNREEIMAFLHRFVKQRQQLLIETQSGRVGVPANKREFTVMDYIGTNYGM